MLLRLLPAPTSSNPSPATILFTLPLTASPYTAKGLPLPTALSMHRTFCLQEDVECGNALLGDKSSWIAGVVDEVTFCIKSSQITAHLIDGSSVALPVTAVCLDMLQRVMDHVQLSFATTSGPDSPTVAESSTSRRSTSGLLLTLLSPLLNQSMSAQQAMPPRGSSATQNTSRLHRRQARSILVDAYRRHVLPALKEVLPQNYLLWILQGEIVMKQSEWEATKEDVERVLEASGHRYGMPRSSAKTGSRYGLGRSSPFFGDSSSSLTCSSMESSDDDSTPPQTPATSTWNATHGPITLSPLAHLSSLPPSSVVIPSQRPKYASLVAQLASLASRLSALTKLSMHLEREDGRRKWLEGMESSRLLEKSLRRALSNSSALSRRFAHSAQRPLRCSPLRQSNVQRSLPVHPAMESSEDEDACDDSISERSASSMSVDYDFTVSKTPSLRSESPDMDTSDDSEIDIHAELAITAAQSPTHQDDSNQFETTAERVEVVSAEEADNDEPELVAFHSVLATAYAPASKPSDTKARLAWKAKAISTVQVIA